MTPCTASVLQASASRAASCRAASALAASARRCASFSVAILAASSAAPWIMTHRLL